jgi:dihydrolipoamide dehydrogenase
VTLIQSGPLLIPGCESFAGEMVRAALEKRGVKVLTETTAERVERAADGSLRLSLSNGSAVVADQILVAAGREPSTRDIGLETVGLKPGTWLEVDESMRVTAVAGGWLYAVGGVNHRALLTHMGKYQARACGDAIAARAAGRLGASVEAWSRYAATADAASVPQVIFTEPEVAAVACRWRRQNSAVCMCAPSTTTSVTSPVRRSTPTATPAAPGSSSTPIATSSPARPSLRPAAGELLHAATVAVVGAVPLDRLWHAVPSYPTISEIWLRLLETFGL